MFLNVAHLSICIKMYLFFYQKIIFKQNLRIKKNLHIILSHITLPIVVTNFNSAINVYCSMTNANKMLHTERCDCCYQIIFFMNGKIHRKSENMVKRYLQRK